MRSALITLLGILHREALRFLGQRGRLVAALVRPLVWLFVFASGVLGVAALWGIRMSWQGYLAAVPAMALAGLMLGALGLRLSSFIKQLENFAGVMNFVILPMFFLSSALYPLWKMAEASPRLVRLYALNPFSQAVELIRFALYTLLNLPALGWTCLATLSFAAAALWGYDPARGLQNRKA